MPSIPPPYTSDRPAAAAQTSGPNPLDDFLLPEQPAGLDPTSPIGVRAPTADTEPDPCAPGEAARPVGRAYLHTLLTAVQERLVADRIVDDLTTATEREDRERQRRLVADLAWKLVPDTLPVVELTRSDQTHLVAAVVDYVCGYGPLQDLLEDPKITEIIARWTDPVLIERAGVLQESSVRFADSNQLLQVIRRVAREVNREISEAEPLMNAWLKDGSRVHAAIPPASIAGPVLTIRKFPDRFYNLDELVAFGSLPAEAAAWLVQCVQAKVNIVVSGGTSSGKTALLRALAFHVPAHEYLITIEDIWELRLRQQRTRVTELVRREAGSDGAGEISIRRLVVESLRMRPDRIIVGEVRGAEALDLLTALSTGHDGGLCTIHANTPVEAITNRIPTAAAFAGEVDLQTAIRQTNYVIELVVQVGRLPTGERQVSEIATITPDTDDPQRAHITVVWKRQKGHLVQVGYPSASVAAKLSRHQMQAAEHQTDQENR